MKKELGSVEAGPSIQFVDGGVLDVGQGALGPFMIDLNVVQLPEPLHESHFYVAPTNYPAPAPISADTSPGIKVLNGVIVLQSQVM